MIDGLRGYPTYKCSGVPWMGDIPAHWTVQRQRNVVDMRVSGIDKHSKEGEQPVRLCNYVDVYKNDRITKRIAFMRATALPDDIKRYRLRIGDVLITKDSETWDDIGVPSLVEYAAADLVSGYHLALLRPRERVLHGAYLHRALQAPSVAYQFHISANGVTRYGLSHSAIKSVALPIPPLDEQSAIVCFLDDAERRIRHYIRVKKKLIALLNEQKLVTIHRAVTNGLAPSAPAKPSNVEWLTRLPENWERSTVKLLARAGASKFTDGDWIELPYITESGVRLLQTGNVGVGVYREKGFRYISEETFRLLKCTEVEPNDVLICRLDGPVGRACLAPRLGVRMITSVDNAVLKVRNDVDPRYVVYVMSSPGWLNWVASICRAGGGFRYRISRSMLGNASIPLPSSAEQSAIADFLDRELAASRATSNRLEQEINLIQEYRIRLVADVVTGKLDVREAAARLPDDVEEPAPLDQADAVIDDEEDDVDAVPEEADA
jgi:type I restriction enzyme S subunit